MSAIPASNDVLDPAISLLQVADVAKKLGVPVTRVQQLLRDHQLIAVRRDGVLGIPEVFFGEDDEILGSFPGLVAVLRDGGFTEEEILVWLFREDDSLPGTPVQALHGHLAREVVRRAQALGF